MEALLILFSEPATWMALLTLILMEVILGIDNLIFISILTNRLPKGQQQKARRIGIALALIMRLGLLATVAFIVSLTAPVITVMNHAFSWRDLIMLAGGLFLVYKAIAEIHQMVDPDAIKKAKNYAGLSLTFGAGIGQIILVDAVFSIDSIITAVGMTNHVSIMVIAVVVAVSVMLLSAEPLAAFIDKNPSVLMLALGFLLVIGTILIAEGFGVHFPKKYIYVAMAFSIFIEALNLLARRARTQANHEP